MLKVKAVAKINPQKPDVAPQYYASAIHDEIVDMNKFATLVASQCSLGRSDVHALLLTMIDLIPSLLAEGKIVSLGELGTFSVNVKSEPADTPEKLSRKQVKGLNVVYRPSVMFKKKLSITDISVVR